jgi:hypothetical protein
MAAMRTTSTFLAAALCALAAACGGKSAPASTGPGNTGGAGDPAGGDAAKLVEAIGAMAVPEPCNNDDGTANLKDHLAAQREVLGGEAATDTTFDCQPPMEQAAGRARSRGSVRRRVLLGLPDHLQGRRGRRDRPGQRLLRRAGVSGRRQPSG